GQSGELVALQRTVLADVVLEGGPVDELGDDERVHAVHLRVQHPGDRVVAHPVQQVDLAPQARPGGRIGGDRVVQDLDGDPVAVGVDRLVHRPHPAGADAPHQTVALDLPHAAKPTQAPTEPPEAPAGNLTSTAPRRNDQPCPQVSTRSSSSPTGCPSTSRRPPTAPPTGPALP